MLGVLLLLHAALLLAVAGSANSSSRDCPGNYACCCVMRASDYSAEHSSSNGARGRVDSRRWPRYHNHRCVAAGAGARIEMGLLECPLMAFIAIAVQLRVALGLGWVDINLHGALERCRCASRCCGQRLDRAS